MYTKRERHPISFLDFPQLVGTAAHGVFKTPEEIAKQFNLYVEQSFDDQLGMYSFVAFEKDGNQFGCRRYFGSPEKQGCMVSILGAKASDERRLIARALEIKVQDVHVIGGRW